MSITTGESALPELLNKQGKRHSVNPVGNNLEISGEPGRKLIFLESIRGLAAFIVVISHLVFAFYPLLKLDAESLKSESALIQTLAVSPLRIFHAGEFCVSVFFVLSGFVLSLSFFQTRNTGAISSAAFRRYLRLMIPVFASVMISWLLLRTGCYKNSEASQLIPGSDWLGSFFHFQMSFFEALKQGVFKVFFRSTIDTPINPVLWTMSVELFGSFLVYSFLALWGNSCRRWLIYSILGFVLWKSIGMHYFQFLCGIALCDFYINKPNWIAKVTSLRWVGLIALMLGVVFGGLRQDWILMTTGISVRGSTFYPTLGAILIIASSVYSRPLQQILEFRAFAFLGKISFPLYLVHPLILFSVTSWVYIKARATQHSHNWSALVAGLVCVAVSVVAAWALYYLSDLPAIKLGKRFEGLFLASRTRNSGR